MFGSQKLYLTKNQLEFFSTSLNPLNLGMLFFPLENLHI